MSISISVSVNGNYKVPVTTKYGDSEASTEVITGRGHSGPFVKHIPYYHGSNASNIVTVTIGPEEQDNGDAMGRTPSGFGTVGDGAAGLKEGPQ
jgi:hypothetical protein